MNLTRQSASASAGLLFAFGLLTGVAMSPTITYYAGREPAGAAAEERSGPDT